MRTASDGVSLFLVWQKVVGAGSHQVRDSGLPVVSSRFELRRLRFTNPTTALYD